jgi:hypothetical protein
MPPDVEKPEPTLPCPACKETPGRQFDRDAGGGHYDDCDACHGTGQVRDLAAARLKIEADGKAG